MQDHKSLARVIASANRNHQCVAVGGTVSWVNVNVLTVKAMGAVIGVAVAADGLHAVKTIKVLDPSLKLPFITHAESPWLLLFGRASTGNTALTTTVTMCPSCHGRMAICIYTHLDRVLWYPLCVGSS